MMMKHFIVALLAAASAATAYGQVGEVSLSGGTSRMNQNSLGSLSDGAGGTSAATVDTNFRLGLRLTLNSYRFFGHEFGYAYNRGALKISGGGSSIEYGMPIHQGMYNFLAYATPEGSKIRPYGTGGVHFSTFYPPGASVFQGNGITKFGYNYGAGLKVRVTETWMTRFDFRDYVTGKPDFGFANLSGRLHQVEISAGIGMAF
jgi:opacity protein-like surface antigen